MSLENANENALYDVEIEKFILSAMLIKDGASVPLVSSILDKEDFYRPQHQILFDNIEKIYAENGAVNIALLANRMKDTGDLEKVGLVYLHSLIEVAHTDAYQKQYATIIKEKSKKRKFLEELRKIASDVKNPIKDFSKNVYDAGQIISQYQATTEFNTRMTDGAEYFKHYFNAEIAANRDFAKRKTGFFNLDNNQIFNAGLYVIGATPACGKTTFCWQLLNQLADNGEYCIFCSYEMSRLEMYSKTVACELFKLDNKMTLTAADIRRGAFTGAMDMIIEELQEKPGVRVIELSNETVDD